MGGVISVLRIFSKRFIEISNMNRGLGALRLFRRNASTTATVDELSSLPRGDRLTRINSKSTDHQSSRLFYPVFFLPFFLFFASANFMTWWADHKAHAGDNLIDPDTHRARITSRHKDSRPAGEFNHKSSTTVKRVTDH